MDHGQRINSMLLNPDIFGPEPDPVPCPYCGRLLKYEDYCGDDGEHVLWSMLPEPCTCSGYLSELDRQAEARRQRELREAERRLSDVYNRLISETLYGHGLTSARSRCTLDRYEPLNDVQAAALHQATCYVADFGSMQTTGTGLLLSGPNGTGKTHLALGCAIALRHAGCRGVMYRSASEIQREMRCAWDRHISESAVMMAYTTLPLLVIDDIGKQFSTDYMQHCLYEIFDGRYSRRLPTILTTNLTPSVLGAGISTDQDLSSAVVSRLMESMICVPVTGNDYRKRLHAVPEAVPSTLAEYVV